MSNMHFHSRIYGRQLIIRSDNLALCNTVRNSLTGQNPLVQRYLQRIKEYNPQIIHIKGVENVVADALSRPPQTATMYVRGPGSHETDPDYEEILDSENKDSEGELVGVKEQTINQGKIDRNSVVLLQKQEQDLIETARRMKEVKFNISFRTSLIFH